MRQKFQLPLFPEGAHRALISVMCVEDEEYREPPLVGVLIKALFGLLGCVMVFTVGWGLLNPPPAKAPSAPPEPMCYTIWTAVVPGCGAPEPKRAGPSRSPSPARVAEASDFAAAALDGLVAVPALVSQRPREDQKSFDQGTTVGHSQR